MRIPLFFSFVLVCLALPLHADEPTPPPSPEEVVAGFNKENPGIRVDLKNQWVDLDAKVCLRDAPMLEVLVCTPMTKEHESILVSNVKPSQLHLALLLLGLEPGAPRSVRWVGPNGDQPQVIPARGAEVALFLITTVKAKENGKEVEKQVEVPASDWLFNEKTQKKATNNRWLFAGSMMAKTPEGKPYYWADGEGDMISTVHFGDETLAPHNNKTKDNDSEGEELGCNTALIPAVDTKVVVRIKPVKKEPAASQESATPKTEGKKTE